MASLTQASITARKTIRYTIFLIIFLIIGRMLWGVVLGIYHRVFPPPPPSATVAFGKLPSLPFPDRTGLASLTFALETPDGGLPSTPNLLKVYFMPKLSANLLSLDFAKERARSLNYNPEPETTSDSVYKFKANNSPSVLQTDIITGAFSLSYDLSADPAPLSSRPVAPEVATSTVKGFLSTAKMLPEDLTGPSSHQFLKHEASGLAPATSLSDANLVKVHLFRKEYEKMPSLTSTPNEGNIWFIVSGITQRGKDLIAGEYHYFPVDETQFSTYPVKPVETAWHELTAGNYFSASAGSVNEGEEVKIRRVYLAYYDPGVPTDFFQPIWVFEGTDKNFVAYVPAVSSEYYGE